MQRMAEESMEMLPFYNIFNEWYATQTSKKIRAVCQSKAEMVSVFLQQFRSDILKAQITKNNG